MTIAPIFTVWFVRFDRIGLVRLNHLRDASKWIIQVWEAVRRITYHWHVRFDRNGLFRLDSNRLIRLNHLRVAIRVEEAIRMTIAPVLTVWFVRFDRIELRFITRIWGELKVFFGSIRFLGGTLCPVDVVKDSIEITKTSTGLEKVPFLPLIKVVLQPTVHLFLVPSVASGN